MNNETYTPDPTNAIADNNGGRAKGNFGYSLGLSIGVIIIFIIITYISYVRRLGGNPNNHNATQHAATAHRAGGLDESTIKSYPEFEYSQLKIDSKGLISGCSICLMDYKESDGVRLLPDCEHFFHVGCVDRWLSMHPTCPICRNSLVGVNVHR